MRIFACCGYSCCIPFFFLPKLEFLPQTLPKRPQIPNRGALKSVALANFKQAALQVALQLRK